jgi:acyl-CoA thioester hydrolase
MEPAEAHGMKFDDSTRPPEGAAVTTIEHRVCFYETDAMMVVHHANYLRFFEQVRVQWLDDHDQPYTKYIEQDLHFATTNVEVNYHRSARFDDILSVTTWLQWARGASLQMAYLVKNGDELIASGTSEHAAVSSGGRVRRIPRESRERLARASAAI